MCGNVFFEEHQGDIATVTPQFTWTHNETFRMTDFALCVIRKWDYSLRAYRTRSHLETQLNS